MHQMCRTVTYLAGLTFLLIGVSHAQSLGDVAREQRQNQQAKKDQPAPKVITNEDLPERQAAAAPQKAQSHEPIPHHNPSKSAEQWRKEIEAQEHSIATLQSQMERLNSTIHFAESASFYNSALHNERQELKQVQVQRMQDQLDEQKKRLGEMQEAARKDGFGNAVYEP